MARCYLNDPPTMDDGMPMTPQCCCNCHWHATVNHHCTTLPRPKDDSGTPMRNCVCSVQKSHPGGGSKIFACLMSVGHWDPRDGRIRVYDNWPEHDYGCEGYQPRQKPKESE